MASALESYIRAYLVALSVFIIKTFSAISKYIEPLLNIIDKEPEFWRARYFTSQILSGVQFAEALEVWNSALIKVMISIFEQRPIKEFPKEAWIIPVRDDLKKHLDILCHHDDPNAYKACVDAASILMYERDWDSVEYYAKRALKMAQKANYYDQDIWVIFSYLALERSSSKDAIKYARKAFTGGYLLYQLIADMVETEGEDSPSYYSLKTLLLSLLDCKPVNIILADAVEGINKFGYHPDILAQMDVLAYRFDAGAAEFTTKFEENIIRKISNYNTIPRLISLAEYYLSKKKFDIARAIYQRLLDNVDTNVAKYILKYRMLLAEPFEHSKTFLDKHLSLANEIESQSGISILLIRDMVSYLYYRAAKIVAGSDIGLRLSLLRKAIRYWPYKPDIAYGPLSLLMSDFITLREWGIALDIAPTVVLSWNAISNPYLLIFDLIHIGEYYWPFRAGLNITVNRYTSKKTDDFIFNGSYRRTMWRLIRYLAREGYDLREFIPQVL